MTFPFPWLQVGDGSLLLTLRHHPDPFCSLTYYSKNLDVILAKLEAPGTVFSMKPGPEEMARRYVFQTPDGLNIALVDFVEGFKQPEGYTVLNFPPDDFFKPAKYPNTACGIFGEFAHPVKDLDASIIYWERLGFHFKERYSQPYPWTVMTDGLAVVGLHQTTAFDYPAITYFAADQAAKTEKLKAKGLAGFTTKGNGSVTLQTPEGQHINLFKIGM